MLPAFHERREIPTVLHHRRALVLLPLLLLVVGCETRDGRSARREAPPVRGVEPTAPPVVPEPTRITYRVTGTIRNANITYVSSLQGTTQVVSDLPWFATFDTRAESVFVYLAAEAPIDNFLEGSITVQIFVGGELFREARAFGFQPSVAVSGEVSQ
jgi:hypothetical protein